MSSKVAQDETATHWDRSQQDLLEWQVAAIEEGIKDEESGNLVPHDEVMAVWRKRLEHQMDQGGATRS